MKYPNRLQWCIIWTSVWAAAHVWTDLRSTDFLPDDSREWGLAAYLARACTYQHRQQFAISIVVVGALLVWQASGWKWGRERGTKGE